MKLIFNIVAIVLLVCSSSLALAQSDQSQEPRLQYQLSIGEKSLTVVENEPSYLSGVFTNPKVKVKPDSFRVFPYQGISFKYPRTFTFEADVDDSDSISWTLSGNDLKIMYFVMTIELTTENFAKNLIKQFGAEKSKIIDANTKLKLGNEVLSGTKLRVTLVDHTMEMSIYSVPSSAEQTRLLVFQDSLDKSGKGSKEGAETLELIKSSFSLNPS